MSHIANGRIYETQAEHDFRIEAENRRYASKKLRSRAKTRNTVLRRECMVRAAQKCEICEFSFWSILLLHHITPVQLGGPAEPSNLIVLCPNCHGLVHNYSHSRQAKESSYPAWLKALTEIGLSELQAKRLIRVASKGVRILEDGSLLDYQQPGPLECVIIDDHPTTITDVGES